MNNTGFDDKEFQRLVEQIKIENPKLDIEFCKYIAGSYLLYDVMKIEKPSNDAEEFKKTNDMIEELTIEA